MQWTMPHRVLQIVASLIGLAAAGSFAMGVISAPQRGGRLPGEKAPGAAATGAAIEATEATPLSDERIEGAPPPSADDSKDDEKTTEADAGNSDADSSAAAAAAGNVTTAQAKPAKPAQSAAPVPEQTLGGPPAPDEPPH